MAVIPMQQYTQSTDHSPKRKRRRRFAKIDALPGEEVRDGEYEGVVIKNQKVFSFGSSGFDPENTIGCILSKIPREASTSGTVQAFILAFEDPRVFGSPVYFGAIFSFSGTSRGSDAELSIIGQIWNKFAYAHQWIRNCFLHQQGMDDGQASLIDGCSSQRMSYPGLWAGIDEKRASFHASEQGREKWLSGKCQSDCS